MRKFIAYPGHPEKLEKLYEIAYNLWFAWNYDVINLFYRIDPKLFRSSEHNPVRFLHSLPGEKMDALAEDDGFMFELEKVHSKFKSYMNYKSDSTCPLGSIAYFSMEYGLHESIPIYAGGLGILAGDFLKGASDMDIPLTGVGLLYSHGYFIQKIDPSGNQKELEKKPFDKSLIPISEMREPGGGNPIIITSEFAGQTVRAKLWQADIGKTKLMLLDTDIDENSASARSITDGLYPADRDKRMLQELLLGIGGVQALSAAGCEPDVYHLNEGHSAFLIIARLRKLMAEQSFSLSEARAIIKASTVFTTHTPVVAGNEHYPAEMVQKYIEPELKKAGLGFEDIKKFGLMGEDRETFWLPAMAIHFSGYTNGVSKRHQEVSNRMWTPLFPGLSPLEVPIKHITNGVHNSWISEPFTDIFNRYMGPNYIHSTENDEIWNGIFEIPEEEIWKAHRRNKQDMIVFLRKRLAESLASRGYSPAKISENTKKLNPDILTIVFARRFAAYKRPALLLNDREKLKNVLSNPEKPVQLIFAGKAHPADEHGKEIIKEILDFAKENDFEDRIFFFENYDINLARHLVWGADVWLNTPVEYNEASGTSGMKAGMNGVLNLSVIDGWWVEGYNRKNGWGITAEELSAHPGLREDAEANQIYTLLEEEITGLFYGRNEFGIPAEWVKMMKESIFSVCRKFNINRTLSDYMKNAYTPCIDRSNKLRADEYSMVREASEHKEETLKAWPGVNFISFESGLEEKARITEGDEINVRCKVELKEANPDCFRVELFYVTGEKSYEIIPMEPQSIQDGQAVYAGSFRVAGRGGQGITARLRPADQTVRELYPELVKWQEG